MDADRAKEFRDKLSKLIEEYEVTITSDNMGDIWLNPKSGHALGWWRCGKIDERNWEPW